MKARAVIGANFGDEGKGLMTDYLVHKHGSNLVVRFNGGAQAGHTVVTPDGRRHVFSHFGSGSFSGAATLLSRFFIVNPMIFKRERQELEKKAPVNLNVTLDLNAPVTTPFDMLINQLVEQKRGTNRHGSCGLGIGETIERAEQFMELKVSDLHNEMLLEEKLLKIRDFWVPIRKVQLGLGSELDHILLSDQLIDSYLEDVEYLLKNSTQGSDEQTLQTAFNPIFEGAQGLLLDQDHEYFPYVTRSSTGIKNVLTLMGTHYRELDVTYMTRAYLTRHGAGPLIRELDQIPFKGIVDKTNIKNDWQGSLRFAHLDLDLLKKTIYNDLLNNKLNYKVRPVVAITCLDQCDEIVPVQHEGHTRYLSNTATRDIGDFIADRLGISNNHFKSFGPSRTDVVDYMKAADALMDYRSDKLQAARAKKSGKPTGKIFSWRT